MNEFLGQFWALLLGTLNMIIIKLIIVYIFTLLLPLSKPSLDDVTDDDREVDLDMEKLSNADDLSWSLSSF